MFHAWRTIGRRAGAGLVGSLLATIVLLPAGALPAQAGPVVLGPVAKEASVAPFRFAPTAGSERLLRIAGLDASGAREVMNDEGEVLLVLPDAIGVMRALTASPLAASSPISAEVRAAASTPGLTSAPPALIPLPPGVWSGLAGLGALAGVSLMKKLRHLR